MLGLRLARFPHSARGLLLLSLWLRDAALAPLIALGLYVVNLGSILLFAGAELSERKKLKWMEIINSRLQGARPSWTAKDMLDHAALVRIALQRYTFRLRGVRNES